MTAPTLQRRAWLRAAGAGLASLAAFRVEGQALHPERTAPAWPTAFDEVDHFDVAHRVRDGEAFAAPAPTRCHDVVVVGGGISGLTALDRLQAAGASGLLLEKEGEPGGNARRRRRAGVFQPLGALVNQGPIAPFTAFFDELGVPFEAVGGPALAYHAQGVLVPDPFGENAARLPFPAGEQQAFAQAAGWLRRYLDPRQGIFFPRSDNTPAIKALDKMTLHAFFQRQGVEGELRHCLDILLSARVGEDGRAVSAWTGLYLLSNLLRPAYTFPGGHGALSQALHRRIAARDPASVETGFTVVGVRHRPAGKVWVTGLTARGALETIECRCVVMAVPKVIASRLVEGLAQDRAGALRQLRYNAYLVAQVVTRPAPRLPAAPAFEIACRDLSSRFVVAADWLPSNRDPAGRRFFTVYVPLPGAAGRMALLQRPAASWARQVLQDLQTVHPAIEGHVEDIVLHRWGHPMVSPGPDMAACLDQLREPFGQVVFAHSDTFGLCGLYSAVWTGMDAHAEALLRVT